MTGNERWITSLLLAHLTLMLLRYLKDESIFKMPGGIILFSVRDIHLNKSISSHPTCECLALGRFW
jgi:hypothetical protein